MNAEQQQQLLTILELGREGEWRPEIIVGLIMRYLQAQDVDVTIAADVEAGVITLTF